MIIYHIIGTLQPDSASHYTYSRFLAVLRWQTPLLVMAGQPVQHEHPESQHEEGDLSVMRPSTLEPGDLVLSAGDVRVREPCFAGVPANDYAYGSEDDEAHDSRRMTHADNYDATPNCAPGQ